MSSWCTGATHGGGGAAGKDDTQSETDELVVLYAFEEQAERVKTREEILAERLRDIAQFQFETAENPENDPTGAQVYLDTCKQQDATSFMRYPTTSIARDLMKETTTLDVSFAGLGTKGCKALADALRINTQIVSLILTGNHMSPSAALEVVHALNETRTVSELDLAVNDIGKLELAVSGLPTLRGGAVINELLAPGNATQTLSLRQNSLGDADIALFSETLAENVVLQQLDLSYNKIGYMGAVELAKVLSRNGDLRDLNLEWNAFRASGAVHLLAEGFLANNTIKSFNMSNCGLDDPCAQLIAKIISENAVEEITIANNRISSAGGEAIAKGLQGTSSLTTLVLDGNTLGDSGCSAILNVVLSGDVGTLKKLSLQHCGCLQETEQRGLEGNSTTLTILISEGCSKAGETVYGM